MNPTHSDFTVLNSHLERNQMTTKYKAFLTLAYQYGGNFLTKSGKTLQKRLFRRHFSERIQQIHLI